MAKRIEQIKVTSRLPAPLVNRAKQYAADYETDLQVLVAEAVETFLKGGRA